MQLTSDAVREKLAAEVELTLTDGSVLTGQFYLHVRQRILDIMNDERSYVPFTESKGEFYVLNKSIIARIKPIDETD